MSRSVSVHKTLFVLIIPALIFSLSVSKAIAIEGDNDLSERYKTLGEQIAQLRAQLDKLLVLKGDAELCTNFSYTMRQGSTDSSTSGQVSKLQKFLMQSGSFPQGEVTGYFGPKTELAVKNWQASRGVVANGTPDTTGYGVVGPTTRTSLNRDCSYMAIAKVPQTGEDTSIIVIRNITNSNNPVVTGTADNAKNIRVVVYKGQNSITNVLTDADIVYSSDTISDKEIVITDGRWTDTVEEFLSKGQYTLDVYFTNINNSETSHVTEVFTVETW